MRNLPNNDPDYPLGTVIAYGPTAERATKLVAGIIPSEGADPTMIQRWFGGNGDIRSNRKIALEVGDFFKANGARRGLATRDIMGCEHEEGIDYPLGAVCGECPFWAESERRTPVNDEGDDGHITTGEIILALAEDRACPPKAALVSADVRREELTEHLLVIIRDALDHMQEVSAEEEMLCLYGFFLFAKWRELRALPLVLQWLALPLEDLSDFVESVLLEAGPRILASVCGGEQSAIRAFVENREADESRRSVALNALVALTLWGEMPRETLIAYLQELLTDKLEREQNFLWAEIACIAGELGAKELLPLIRGAYADGLVDERVVGLEELEEGFAMEEGIDPVFLERNQPITDVAEEMEQWVMPYWDSEDMVSELAKMEGVKIGRNDPCPCGSKKKFKKCCGAV